MAPKLNEIIRKYKISEEDQILLGLVRSPMLSGRITAGNKEKFEMICADLKSTQSEELRKLMKYYTSKGKINWSKVKEQKGEKNNEKTVPVRVKVNEELKTKVSEQCKDNKVTVSAYISYLVVTYINKNGG